MRFSSPPCFVFRFVFLQNNYIVTYRTRICRILITTFTLKTSYVYVGFFFLEYIWIFFSFFVLFFLFVCLFSSKRKSPGPQRERRSRVFWRGERDTEKRADECREEEEGQGLEYLSLFSRSRSFSLPRRDASLCHGSVMRKIPPACLVSGR